MTPLEIVLLVALAATLAGAAYLLREAEVEARMLRGDAAEARGQAARAQARDDAETAAAPHPALSPEARTEITKALSTPLVRCNDCGGVHSIACPRVRRRRFRTDGETLLEVEYWPEPWDKDHILFAEDVAE